MSTIERLETLDGQVIQKPTVYIVGFAPSWVETPWDDPIAERWGMNALFKIAGDKPWDRWYQLHDIDIAHADDKHEHIDWLRKTGIPCFVWPDHVEKMREAGVNAHPYPKAEVLARFGRYFTNSVSWMIAHAILEDRIKVGVYGVDMAQDSEYAHQRPSCEWMIGVAQGLGVLVDIPGSSDLLKTPFLYGAEDHNPLRVKMEARFKELSERRQNLEQQLSQARGQVGQLESVLNQILGAQEDTNYWLRAWTMPQN